MKKINNNGVVESKNFLKCMFCDRESYQSGRFISNNMNLIQILCKEHFLQLLDAQQGITLVNEENNPVEASGVRE